MSRYYDTAGEPVDPHAVLDVRDRIEDAQRPSHAGRPSRGVPLMPTPGTDLDEQGCDQLGVYWGWDR